MRNSINFNVKAEVVDIRSDTPSEKDSFLIDTNVWYWMTYPKASLLARPAKTYQISDYPTYISLARSVDSCLAYSGFSLAELAHIIEKAELEFFNPSTRPKEYRHNYPTERANVVAEVQSIWNQIKAIAVSVELMVDEKTTDDALIRFETEPLDGYDLFILETMKKENINNIITDDGDYCTVPGITVFTANRNMINAAKVQGKLLTR